MGLLVVWAAFGQAAVAQVAGGSVPARYRIAARSLISSRVDRTSVTATEGAVHEAVARAAGLAADLGAVEDGKALEHMQLLLVRPAERQAAFDQMVEALHDPGNPSFHQWLTPEQIGAEFGPSPADIATVTGFLASEGFTVNFTAKSGMYIDFTGTAAQVRQSFHTEVHNFRMADGKTHYSAASAAMIPAALAPAIAGFMSLSDVPFHPMHHVVPVKSPAAPLVYSGGSEGVGAQDFYTIYNENPLLTASTPINGTGQTIALLEETDINTADVTYFRTTFAITPNTPALTVAHGSSSVPCSDPGVTSQNEEAEAVLDTEWAGAVAPAATLLFMSCASTATNGIFLSAEAVIEDNLAGVMSLSYGGTENGNSTIARSLNSLYEQASAQGQTVVVSSGDSGSDMESDGLSIAQYGLNVNALGSTNYNIAAGGTDFQDTYNSRIDAGSSFGSAAFWNTSNGTGLGSARSYIPETTWNGTCASSLENAANEGLAAAPQAFCDDGSRNNGYLTPLGGGGGTSTLHGRPGWQNGTVYGLPSTTNYPERLLPDISLFASNGVWGHVIFFYQSDGNSGLSGAGGTSFVAPQLAGVFALVAQKTGSRVGLANVQLYNLAGQQFGTSSFTGSACNGSGASGVGETTSLPSSSCIFYDVQTGNNSDACSAGTPNCYSDSGQPYGLLSTSTSAAVPAYSAGQGFDMATGIGSINIANLVNNWTTTTLRPTVATLSLARTAFPVGNSIAYSITVAPASGTGTPTGAVTLESATALVYEADANLNSGSASGSTRNFSAGTYTVSSKYFGDGTFAGSTSPGIVVTVSKAPTTTTLATPSPSSGNTYGSTVSLSATLSPTTAGVFTAGGTISFLDGATTICSAVAFNTSGVATCTSPALSVGSHSFTAVYTGDSEFAGSTSLAQVISVAKATPAVIANTAGASYGTSTILLTGQVSYSAGSAPTGAYTFTVDSGNPMVANCTGSSSPLYCTATYNIAALQGGTHTLTGAVAADANYNSASNSTSLTIYQVAPTLTFSVANQTYSTTSFTVAASSNSPGAITYYVVSGPATVSGSSVTLTGVGTVVLQASQASSPDYLAGTQNASFVVTAAASVWLGNQNSTVSAFSLAGAALSGGSGFSGGGLATIPTPLGMAFDHAGSLWIASSGGVSEFTKAGSPAAGSAFSGGGVSSPLALAVDGLGQIWVANSNSSVSLLSNAGAAISPSTGYTGAGLSSAPGGMAVDLSGNVWITNSTDNSVTEILGAAGPVAPLATAVANGSTGARP